MRRTQRQLGVASHCSFALVAALGAWAHLATAEEPTRARLGYERGLLVEGCPSESELRDQVSVRLGRVPFSDEAKLELRAKIERQGALLVATLTAEDGSGAPAIRELRSADDDCEELGRALALAISVAIDPMSLMRPSEPSPAPTPSSSEPTEETAPAAPAPVPAEPAAQASSNDPPVLVDPAPARIEGSHPPKDDAPRSSPLRTRSGLGPFLAAAPSALPEVALGGGVRAQVDFPEVVVLGAQAEAVGGPALQTANGATVSAWSWFGRAFVCRPAGWLSLCAQGGAGQLFAEGRGVDRPRRDSAWLTSVGVRLEAAHDLGDSVSAWLALDGDVGLSPVVFEVSDSGVWQSPRFFPRLSLGVLLLP